MYKNAILYFNFPKTTPGPPPSPYLVRIQDSKFTRNFGLHPLYALLSPNAGTALLDIVVTFKMYPAHVLIITEGGQY